MLFLAQMIQFDLTTMLTAVGVGGMSLIVWLSRTRIEKAEDRLESVHAEVTECKVHRATMTARLDHLERRVTRAEDGQ
jgi:hypothetical protein